jgi:uncharacterized membrane protein
LYKKELKLEPAEVTMYMGIVAMPWSFKIIYGFIGDNVRIFGSKRKGHIMMNTLCCSMAMVALMTFGLDLGKYFVTFCVFVSQINMAYNDTITDALTVTASKTGVEDANENLNSICYMLQAIGAIFGAITAGFVSETDVIGPFDCFGFYLVL